MHYFHFDLKKLIEKYKKILLIICISGVLLALIYILLPGGEKKERGIYDEATIVIEKVEDFKNQNNRLPDSLGEIGVTGNEAGPFYSKLDSAHYTVSFIYGDYYEYDSENKQWVGYDDDDD